MAAILLDVGLPGMDGFETAAAIRRRQKTRYVPIIFVTGQDAPERSLEAYAAGAVDYLVKPFDAAVLRSKLSVFIDLHRLRSHTEALDSPCPARRAHRAAQPGAVRGPARAGARPRAQAHRAARRPVRGPRRLQAGERRARPRGRGQGADRGRAPPARARADRRHGRALRRRRVHDPCRGRRRHTRPRANSASAWRTNCHGPTRGGLEVAASVGVAFTANPAATTPDGLIRRADHAMYRSKRPGARRAEVSRVRPGLLSPLAN